jgi:hypothetical protein
VGESTVEIERFTGILESFLARMEFWEHSNSH